MSLFIGTLAFEGQSAQYAVATRLGVFAGSIASALLGLGVLRIGAARSVDAPASDEVQTP
jgi:Na+/H+ antiporter NhaA